MPDTPQNEADETYPRPIVTYILLAVIWIVFIAMAALSQWHISTFPDVVCDLFGYKLNDRMVVNGHLIQWWRFITPVFLHGGLAHVCINSLSLYIIGKQLEPFYGSRRFFLIFMIAGIAGVLASFRFSHIPSLGASGSLFGLVGAGIVFPLRFRSLVDPAQGKRIVIQLTIVALGNLALGFAFSHYVDNSAHIGGLLGGGFAGLFLIPDALDTRALRRVGNGMLSICSAAMTVLILCSAVSQGKWAAGPWWRLTVPIAFHPSGRVGQFQAEWKSSDGSSITISDTAHNPNLLPGAVFMLERKDLTQNAVSVGKWHGRAFAFQTTTDTVALNLIVVYGRIFIITLHTATSRYAEMQPQFDRCFRSISFLHAPPPDLHPIPLVLQKQNSN